MTDLPKIRYATVAEMERLSRPSIRDAVLYCDETGKTYSFQATSGAVRDGDDVLNTGLGGDTRFEAIAGGTVPGGTIAWGSVNKTGSSLADLATRTHSLLTSIGADDHHAQVHGSADHTGTIGAWSQIDKTTSSIADITTRSHTALADIGTKTHAQIDTHVNSTSNPHSVNAAQAGAYATTKTAISDAFLGINYGRIADGAAQCSLYSGTGVTDFSQLIRASGTNGQTSFNAYGTGGLAFTVVGAGLFYLATTNTPRWTTSATGQFYPWGDALYSFGLYNNRWSEGHFAKLVAGMGVSSPVAKLTAYDNTTGATDPVSLVHQDHASNTGIAHKIVHDGTGDLWHAYNGANSRGHLTYDGILDIYTGFRVNAAATAGYVLQGNGTNIVPTALYTIIPVVFYEAGSVLSTGLKGYSLPIPFNCEIVEWTLLGDVSGSVVVDVWKDTYANYPPTVADTITAAAKPTISSATKAQSSALTGWTTSITAGDILGWNIDSLSTFTWLGFALKVRRT